MTSIGNVSFLAQSLSQTQRLIQQRGIMDDLQRQVTTQKKYDSFSGFGTDSMSLQRLRSTLALREKYLNNITISSNRMELMSKAMAKMSQIGNQLVTAVNTVDPTNIQNLNQLAQQNLQFVEELVNQKMDGQYLFSGSDTANQPFINDSTLNSNFANQINTWLTNAAPNADQTLFNTTDGFSTTQLGLSGGLAAAGSLTSRIDTSTDIDYTVKADIPGIKDLIRALSFIANMKVPDPAAGHVATTTQFNNVMSHIATTLSSSVVAINDVNQQLIGKFNLIKSIKDNHESDQALLQTQLDKMENADPNTAIIQLQAVQTQLASSYNVTRIASEMTLTKFI